MRKALAVVLFVGLCYAQEEKRDEKIVVPLTKGELKALEEAAKKAHLDVPDFVRSKALEGIEVQEEIGAKEPEKTDSKESTRKTADGEPKEITPGWIVAGGDWNEKQGIVSTQSGAAAYLKTKDTDIVDFELKGAIRYQRIYNDSKYRLGALFFRWNQAEGLSGYHITFRFAENTVHMESHTPLKAISSTCSIPMARNVWIPFVLRVTGSDATILMGNKSKMQAKLDGKEAIQPQVGLASNGAEVDFRITNLRVIRRAGAEDKESKKQ